MSRRRKLVYKNRRKRKIYFSLLLVCVLLIGLGYSNLVSNLNINGSLSIWKYDKTLYGVLERAAKIGTYAAKYTGEHQDSWANNGTKDIYHWYATSDANGTAILDKNNVIFAGQCWQMIRTTDTGGVKMIYNGEAENNQCLNTRGNHIGYGSRTSQNLASNYYYGTSYEYDSTNNVFSLSGTLTQETWNATAGPTLVGKYTCKQTTESGTCATLYLVESYYNTSSGYVIPITKNSNYFQFGTLEYNTSYNSPAYIGYMYNTVYPVTSKSNSFTVTSSSAWTINTSYYYSDTIDWNTTTANQYTLINNPQQLSTLSGDYSSLVGKYVIRNTSGTNYTTVSYVTAVDSNKVYYKELSGGDLNTSLTIGDSYTESGGVYTLSGNVTNVPYETWYSTSNFSIYKGKYVCDGASTSCTNLKHIYTGSNSNKNSYYYFDTTTTYSYAEDVSFDGTTYTLTGDVKTFWDLFDSTNQGYLPTHHYTCLENGSSCTTVGYVNYLDYRIYYAQLTGVEDVDAALNNMLYASDVNTKNSTIKTGIDAWYAKYLSSYDSYIDDTIFCNDRTIRSLGAWKPDGGTVTSNYYLQFQEYSSSKDLSCDRVTDQFSTLNTGAQLTYKVGLMSNPEMNLLNNDKARVTGQYYWLASPYYFSYYVNAYGRFVSSSGDLFSGNVNNSFGVRPAVSLATGTMYTSGDGSMASPYIVDAIPSSTLMVHDSDANNTFGKSISRDSFESITTVNHINVPVDAIDSWDVSDIQNGTVLAWYTDADSDSKYELYLGQEGGVKANIDSSNAFRNFQNIDSLDLTYFDTTGVQNMNRMFRATGYNSTTFTLDLGNHFDTSSVSDFGSMFGQTGYTSPVFTLNLGNNFDTSNGVIMNSVFWQTGYNSLLFTLDLGDKFDTSHATTMHGMFQEAGYTSPIFTINLGNKFDTSNVTIMCWMFECAGYSNTSFALDLGSKFDTSNVTDMRGMFKSVGYSNQNFALNLGDKFDTSNVTDMAQMFWQSGYSNDAFSLDLGNKFVFTMVTDYSWMFLGWKTTNKLYVKSATEQNWIVSNSDNSNLTTSNVLIRS